MLVSDVFTPAMFDELAASMTAVGWEGVDQVAECYKNDFCQVGWLCSKGRVLVLVGWWAGELVSWWRGVNRTLTLT